MHETLFTICVCEIAVRTVKKKLCNYLLLAFPFFLPFLCLLLVHWLRIDNGRRRKFHSLFIQSRAAASHRIALRQQWKEKDDLVHHHLSFSIDN